MRIAVAVVAVIYKMKNSHADTLPAELPAESSQFELRQTAAPVNDEFASSSFNSSEIMQS